MRKIIVECWSHCGGEWMFYGYFVNIEDIDNHISEKGYDPRFFKIGK